MSDQFGGIRDLLSMRNQRKQASQDRLHSSLSNVGNMVLTKRENKRGRDFDAEQAELGREFQTGEREEAQEFTAGQAQIGRDFTANQAELDRQYQRAAQEIDNAAAMDRLETQIQGSIDELERRNNMAREEYDEGPKTWTDSVTGKTYNWDSNQDFELVKQQMQADRLANEIRLRADLADVGPDASEQIREAYDFAKSELLWDASTQSFRDLSELGDAELRQMFENAILTGGFDGLDPNAIDRAYQLFTAFMERNVPTPEEEVGQDDRPGGIPIESPLGQEFQEDQPGPLGRATLPLVELFGQLFPEDAARLLGDRGEVPPGVRLNNFRNESDLWESLQELAGNPDISPEDRAKIAEYARDLAEEGYAGRDQINQIQAFIDRAMSGQRQTPLSPGGGL